MDDFKVYGEEIVENAEIGDVGINNPLGAKIDNKLPAKPSLWTRVKAFWLQEITVELTPKQQEFEDKLNETLHKEITFESFKKFLFQDVKFGK